MTPSPDERDDAPSTCGLPSIESTFEARLAARFGARRTGAPLDARSRARYVLEGELGRGGMGVVKRVFDADLRRTLAMKVLRGTDKSAPGADTSRDYLGRFIEEAQVTGQLDHPGIVPVHELGVDDRGCVYFTMRMVKGRDLKRIFELVHAGLEGWTPTRALGVLLKVCEAMAYAHAKGVVHRDLKPDNVMVGRFGEVYVMDWGLARVLGREDGRDPRPRETEPATISAVTTDRGDARAHEDDPLVTRDGTVVGTPHYMPPEQAAGRVDEIGPAADVYALGAMLYHLLCGRVPYHRPGDRLSQHTVLAMVIQGAPEPIHALAPHVSFELVAICEKAMAREPGLRYADMSELGEDLRAYLEHRVVRAHQTGAVAEFKKWVERNRGTAAAIAVAIGLAIAAAGFGGTAAVRARANRELADKNRDLEAAEARTRRLADAVLLEQLDEQARELWPAARATLDEPYTRWLADAQSLGARLGEHRATLAEMRARALAWSDAERARDRAAHPLASALAEAKRRRAQQAARLAMRGPAPEPAVELERLAHEIARLEAAVDERATYSFADTSEKWQHNTLAELVRGIERFFEPERGLVADVERRLDVLRRARDELESPAWRAASAAAADPALPYGGQALEPMLGLVPLGRDARSGLLEFAHLATGAIPARDPETGELVMRDDSALVLVLLPGGEALIGAQRDRRAPNYYRDPAQNESPVHRIPLVPFLISKYEMTQGQWLRCSGQNPSFYDPRYTEAGYAHTLLHPVEQVSWNDCELVLARLGLELPTEAQWEYAARAGRTTPWWTGEEPESLRGAVNLADIAAARVDAPFSNVQEWLDDGFAMHAPVDRYRQNPFGLYSVHGNVWEWCRDGYGSYELPFAPGDGERDVPRPPRSRVYRGGGFDDGAAYARASFRDALTPGYRNYMVGVRPARSLGR